MPCASGIRICLTSPRFCKDEVMNILVTGIASDIGFNCGRILKELDEAEAVHGVDIHADHAGKFVFDVCAVAPRAADSGYGDWLASYVDRHRIDCVIPTSEAEISCITAQGFAARIDSRFMVSNARTIEVALDKHACLSFLADQGIAVPAHGLVGDEEPAVWPVVVKPRSGQGSKGLVVVDDATGYRVLAPPGSVWQQQLLPAEEEYTCAVYRSPAAGMRMLAMRRSLQGGLTGKGEVVADPAIVDYVTAIAEALDLAGAMNVQLRKTPQGPRLFEINPRLSSTVMLRHRLGFRDLEWWLTELAGQPVADYSIVPSGARFYRASNEYIVWPRARDSKEPT